MVGASREETEKEMIWNYKKQEEEFNAALDRLPPGSPERLRMLKENIAFLDRSIFISTVGIITSLIAIVLFLLSLKWRVFQPYGWAVLISTWTIFLTKPFMARHWKWLSRIKWPH